jgi:ribosome biogenesis protein MAK21
LQGDTERTVCARVSHHLLQLLQAHPVMKAIVIREAAALVLRAPSSTPATAPGAKATHIRFGDDGKPLPAGGKTDAKGKAKAKDAKPAGAANPHAAYYATVTLNQFVLSPAPADRQVARQLVDIYFTFFQELLGDADSADVDAKREEEVDDDVEPEGGAGRPYKGGRAGAKGKGKARAPNGTDGAGFTEVEDARSRHVSAILTGVNRALPFAKLTMADVGSAQPSARAHVLTPAQVQQAHRHALLDHAHVDLQHLAPGAPSPAAYHVCSPRRSRRRSARGSILPDALLVLA